MKNTLIENIYTLISQDDNSALVLLSDETHPIFKAHFPTQPILPGFIHFEIISELFDMDITTIKKAKFLKPVLPNQTLKYEKNGTKFKVICEDKEIAGFSL
jgi:3-hydroxyacyl-[acyl-carrier-protein] dehydratase